MAVIKDRAKRPDNSLMIGLFIVAAFFIGLLLGDWINDKTHRQAATQHIRAESRLGEMRSAGSGD